MLLATTSMRSSACSAGADWPAHNPFQDGFGCASPAAGGGSVIVVSSTRLESVMPAWASAPPSTSTEEDSTCIRSSEF
jgi:hypothetical protein